ncbi:rhomboid-like protein [Streptomyces sp. NPDC006173]|uniref:rhomboid-like protein n=1 Tax=unclassified Streptomyces TaxID=2593676 RepID=UPI0033C10373
MDGSITGHRPRGAAPTGPDEPAARRGEAVERAGLPAARRPGTAGPTSDGPAANGLDGMPRQRTEQVAAPTARCAAAVPNPAAPVPSALSSDAAPASAPSAAPAHARRPGGLAARAARSVGRLLPTPPGTPFTFGYATVLAVTSYVAGHADPALVRALHQASSTDVAHLVRYPVAVLFASALWIVGGILSPYAAGFLLVLTALERRIGAARAAGVFLLGHVVATLATEVPVGLAVWAGRLPGSSLHRFDYGISFGVAASVGSLAGLLPPWLRWPLLTVFGSVLAEDLITLDDPMTNWGHLLALALGVATWPLVRRAARARGGFRSGRDLTRPPTGTPRAASPDLDADSPAAS